MLEDVFTVIEHGEPGKTLIHLTPEGILSIDLVELLNRCPKALEKIRGEE